MTSAEEKTTAMTAVTLEEVEAITDLKGAKRVAKMFEPEVSLKKCSLPKMKERLRLAVLKSHGEGKDVEALGNVLMEKRKEDYASRNRLLHYFTDLTAVLADMDDKLLQHVDRQERIRGEIERFKSNLADPPDKLIVAGQTSSGKSTLLNIFLGKFEDKDILPTRTLSCTATPCELRYGEECSAVKVVRGVEEPVAFERREEVMYKESSRERRFDHDLVRVTLPCFFLKSGLTLVDTPGIGENYEMSNILKDYVKEHNVFGFVFTLASSTAGGVLPKFQNLIRDLSAPDYVDRFGQRKFDPRSCVFVANFWDQVSEADRPSTRQHIGDTLNEMPAMASFNPDGQLFMMDSNFACLSKNMGLVTSDLSVLIDGLGGFVWKEQRRKLKIYYSWLEDKLLKLLHLLRTYIRRMRQTEVTRTRKRDKNFVVLDDIEKRFKHVMKELGGLVKAKVSECSKHMYDYMASDNARHQVTLWKYGDIPVAEVLDDWVILEYGLDEAIDDRVSDVLHMWELREQVVSKTEEFLMAKVTKDLEVIVKQIDQVQRDLRTVGFNVDLDKLDHHTDDEVDSSESVDSLSSRQFRIKFGKTYGMNIMGGGGGGKSSNMANIADSFAIGPTLKVKKKVKVTQTNSQETYQRDKVQYMRQRAFIIYDKMCKREFCETAMQEQFKTVTDYLKQIQKDTLQNIQNNRFLLEAICADRRNSRDVEDKYIPLESKVTRLFDEVVDFGCTSIHEPDFSPTDIDVKAGSELILTGLFSSVLHGRLTKEEDNSAETTKDVTLYLFSGSANTGLKRSEMLFQERHLRKMKYTDLAKLLGTCEYQGNTCLVLNHHLNTARHLLLGTSFMDRVSCRKKRQTMYISFLSELGTALHYLHCNKLVHPELSLDSVLVKVNDPKSSPVLCNINEPIKIQLPQGSQGGAVNHFLYLPQEVLKGHGLYTDEADMYGLGLTMMELCYHDNIFSQLKQDTSLEEWVGVADPGDFLVKHALTLSRGRKDQEKMTNLWKKIIGKCLHRDPSQRMTINRWHNAWMDVIKADLAPTETGD